MRFLHFSSHSDVIKFKSARQQRLHYKPTGLWLSCGTEWLQFARNAGLDDEYKFQRVYTIDTRELVRIRTSRDVLSFHDRYAVYLPSGTWVIDWNRVRKESGKCGIYIKDAHIPGIRNKTDFLWYATFDICGACIWSDKCVRRIGRPTSVDVK
jgi:hypothetical protein